MGLTGDGTLCVAIALFVLSVVAALFLWNRVVGRARWAVRIGMLLLGDVSALLVAALLMNSAFDFYLSWAELFGSNPSVAVASAQVGRQDARLASRLSAAYHSGRGIVVSVPVTGRQSRVPTKPAWVYLPAAYGNPSLANVQFPVIELLDGFPGSPQSWIQGMDIAHVLDRAIATGEMSPAVVVMPTQNVATPRDTECANALHGPQVDTYLTTDVRTTMVSAFRVQPSGQHWAVAGYSTGGYCAGVLAAQHPSLFAAAASIAGYNAAAHDITTGHLFGRHDPQLAQRLSERANLLWWVTHRPTDRRPILEIATRQDRHSLVADHILDRLAAIHGWPIWQLTLPRGGHNFATFSTELPTMFNWLTRSIGPPLSAMPSVDRLVARPVAPAPTTLPSPGRMSPTNRDLVAAGRPTAATRRRA